jgi:5,10-methylenetetrahydromethanopterin reductase
MSSAEVPWGVWMHAIRPVPELARLAAAAEDFGAAALLLADEGVDRDLYVTLTAIAAATRRLALLPAVRNPHSRLPVAPAAALGSLAAVARGRVVAGRGAGGTLVFGPMGLAPARPFTALAEAVEVIDDLLAGQTVDHTGEFTASRARLSWAPGRLPVAIAGRGPRVERLSAERADWVIVAGKPVADMPAFARTLRARAARLGRRVRIAWNPMVGWAPRHIDNIRPHLSYMTVDMPPAWQERLGIGDSLLAELRTELVSAGAEAAARLVPDSVLATFALTGDREDVARRLAAAIKSVAPDLLVFEVQDYDTGHIGDIAALAAEAGLTASAAQAGLAAPAREVAPGP